MTSLKIVDSHERKKIEQQLKDQFGIEKVEGIMLMSGHERIFLFNGSMKQKEILSIERKVNIERAGIYFAKIVPGEDLVKLSIEGTHILKNEIKKNIYEISEKDMIDWMKGQDLQIKTGFRGFLVIKYKDDFLGCGKASENKIGNFIPKGRRVRERGG